MINPRYANYARAHGRTPDEMRSADLKEWPGGSMTGFVLWNGQALIEAQLEIPKAFSFGSLINHTAYDEWLTKRVNKIVAGTSTGTSSNRLMPDAEAFVRSLMAKIRVKGGKEAILAGGMDDSAEAHQIRSAIIYGGQAFTHIRSGLGDTFLLIWDEYDGSSLIPVSCGDLVLVKIRGLGFRAGYASDFDWSLISRFAIIPTPNIKDETQ